MRSQFHVHAHFFLFWLALSYSSRIFNYLRDRPLHDSLFPNHQQMIAQRNSQDCKIMQEESFQEKKKKEIEEILKGYYEVKIEFSLTR